MAHYKEHCRDCEEKLGKAWGCVHLWLDEYARKYRDDFEIFIVHRVYRHHLRGVKEVRVKWGDEAAKAAEIHILKDEGEILSSEEIHKKYGVEE